MTVQVERLNDAIWQAQDNYEKAQEQAEISHAANREALRKGDDKAVSKHTLDVSNAEASAFCEALRIEALKGHLKNSLLICGTR